MTEAPRVVLFVVGNESRGDDALGPLLLRELAPALPRAVRVVADFQLQVEHALELRGAGIALFIDAACGLDRPFAFGEIGAGEPSASFSHALSPAEVLGVFGRIEPVAPPPAFVLGIRARRFGLGEGLSAGAPADLALAVGFVRELLAAPDVVAWRARGKDAPCPLPGWGGRAS